MRFMAEVSMDSMLADNYAVPVSGTSTIERPGFLVCRMLCSLWARLEEEYKHLIYTHQQIHFYILFKKFKIYIKTLKTLLHFSILRSSSGSTYCSLLKLCVKAISDLLRYINFGDVAPCRVFVCASYAVQSGTGCGLCNPQPVPLCTAYD